MTTFQEDMKAIARSFRFSILIFALTICLVSSAFAFVMAIYMPYALRLTLEEFYAEREFTVVE